MQVKPSVASVVGQIDELHWGQVLMLPQAYGIVEIEDPGGTARQSGVDLLAKLSNILGDPPGSLTDLENLTSEITADIYKTILLLVPRDNVIYLVLHGSGTVYLKRGDQVAVLMHEAGSISGEIKQGDILLLASSGFTRSFLKEELAQVFDHLNAQEASEKLTLLLHEKNGLEGAAALIFEVTSVRSDTNLDQQEISAVAQTGNEEDIQKPRKLKTKLNFSTLRKALSRHNLNRLKHGSRQFIDWTKNSKRNTAVVTAILILLFSLSVILGIIKQANNKQTQKLTAIIGEAQRAFDEGVALLELSPVKGREKLQEVQSMLEPWQKKVSKNTKEGNKIIELYKQSLDNLTQSMQVLAVEPQLFFDVSLIKNNSQASFVALSEDLLAIVDEKTNTVFSLNISSKNGQIIAGGESFNKSSGIAAHVDKVYVLTDEGINQIRTGDKKTDSAVIKKDSEWGTVSAIAVFGGNVYLADTQKSRIWKYLALEKGLPAGRQGFSELREYLNPDTLPNLGTTTNMVIDGSLWLGTTEGKIFKFSQGREVTFTPNGVEPKLGRNLLVFTQDTQKNLYVLDKQNKRVVVLDKDGVYLAQYIWQTDLSPQQIVVSEKQKKILLLVEGKIYTIELK